jgi:choline-sulfatase
MSFLEPSARVPLVFGGPDFGTPRRVSDPASLVDLVPTLAELAGVPMDGLEPDGASLAPLLRGEPGSMSGAHEPVACEYHAEGVNAPAAMIRSGRHKLIVCRDDPDQLYDLESDPLELTNLAGDPAHASTVTSLHEALAARVDLADVERRVLASQRERHLVTRALSTGAVAAWDYQPFVDASAQYVRTREDLYHLQRLARLDARLDAR